MCAGMGEGEITIRRKYRPWSGVWKAAVFVDGERLGTLRHAEERTFSVVAGEHAFEISSGWGGPRSCPVVVAVAPSAILECDGYSEWTGDFIDAYRQVVLLWDAAAWPPEQVRQTDSFWSWRTRVGVWVTARLPNRRSKGTTQ